jgi:glyoxylase-like metal-dependent hydrolase (beta-lactamase superfamily II)
VYTGDILFVGGTPVMWAGPVINWITAIDRILELDADTYVPGHGPVCGREEAEAVKRYWIWLEAAARHRFGLGMSAWEAARDIALSPEFRTYEWSRWSAPERIVINVHTLERERRGELGGEASPRELVTLFSRVALLADELGPAPLQP